MLALKTLSMRARGNVCRSGLMHKSLRSFSGASVERTPVTEIYRDFLPPDVFYGDLQKRGIDFFVGVPDSLLGSFCSYVNDHGDAKAHIIAANEGSAVATACGYHLATGKIPLVYMQNSGFGNAVNPLLSIANETVYSIPMLLLVGWRGEPRKKDEPQHKITGRIQEDMLKSMRVEYDILPDFEEGARECLDYAVDHMKTRNSPYAILVKRQTFEVYKGQKKVEAPYEMTRENAVCHVTAALSDNDVTVSTTGFTSRELFEYRLATKQGHDRDFLTVGSMGHAGSIALGVALPQAGSRNVVTIDGDGALMMHMGSMATIGTLGLSNYKHILINNGCHDSTGGQATPSFDIDFPAVAKACSYKWTNRVETEEELKNILPSFMQAEGPCFLEIRVGRGTRGNLGRPTRSPVQNKTDLMEFLKN